MSLFRRPRRRGIGHEAEGGRAVALVVLVVLAMAAGIWVLAYAGATGKVPPGTTIAGVAVGGRDRTDAERALSDGVRTELAAPLSVTVGAVHAQVAPSDAGLAVDVDASVDRALGVRTWDPRQLWHHYTGGAELEPVLDVDAERMDAVLTDLETRAGRPPQDGSLSVANGRVEVTAPEDGARVDRESARRALVDAWAAGRHSVTLPLVFSPPDVDAAELAAGVQTIANPALSGPVTLAFAGSQVTLAPDEYVDLLTIASREGALGASVDPAALAGVVDPAGHATVPRDASVALVSGVPQVVPAVAGQTYDAGQVATAFLQAVTATGPGRTVTVTGTPVDAAFTDAGGLGIATPVSTFAVAVPSTTGPAFAAAVARLDGAVMRPGETFSLNARVGEIGGSDARLATATWNAGFLAGLTDVARTAPSARSDGLPEGRDAIVAIGGADLVMRNDSPYGVLLSARFNPGSPGVPGSVVVDAWSTKAYDVTATTSAPYGLVARAVVSDATAACVSESGSDGYSVDLVRTVTSLADPTQTRTDTVTTTYPAVDAVACAASPTA